VTGAGRPQLVAALSVAVGVALTLVKLGAGLITGSLGLLSEAAHSGLDLAASAFVLVAVRTAGKPADEEHPYGHGRAENLAAYTEGLVLLVAAAGVAYEAIRRLVAHEGRVDPQLYAVLLVVAIMGVEAVRAVVLWTAGRRAESAALVTDSQERLADILAGAAVLAGLVGARLGYPAADSVAGLAVAAFIAVNAVRILVRAGDELMDRAPAGAAIELRRAIGSVKGINDIRSLRVRRSGNRLLGDARVTTRRTLSVEAAQALSADVQREVERRLPGMDLVLSVEGHTQPENLVERVHAAATRLDQVRDLHNVTVERERDGSLHLSMHVKLPSDVSLADAGGVAAELERLLRVELPEVSRVDVHLEPLEPDLVSGRDVTAERRELADRIASVARKHPQVVGVRDVELSSRNGRITAHVVAAMHGDISLERAHEVESEIETEITRDVPDLAEVVARVTT
jgi:cation diffusion facilitator family transporter